MLFHHSILDSQTQFDEIHATKRNIIYIIFDKYTRNSKGKRSGWFHSFFIKTEHVFHYIAATLEALNPLTPSDPQNLTTFVYGGFVDIWIREMDSSAFSPFLLTVGGRKPTGA
ncbi:hypothetical protein AVEN_75026-1 [Araneus ventricosus]|uniref:Uncharacterized protein n=1 Tax=Araneus ventricosus TaxID=182803 RepID=A0A4Y2GTH9_ARAVE|nr:hypothetical protein AVEN_75026-1 [Araneus ventricosus]